jgi:hypothetical protein
VGRGRRRRAAAGQGGRGGRDPLALPLAGRMSGQRRVRGRRRQAAAGQGKKCGGATLALPLFDLPRATDNVYLGERVFLFYIYIHVFIHCRLRVKHNQVIYKHEVSIVLSSLFLYMFNMVIHNFFPINNKHISILTNTMLLEGTKKLSKKYDRPYFLLPSFIQSQVKLQIL